MRPLPLLVGLLLTGSCTDRAPEQAEPALAEIAAAAGLDTLAITETVEGFLDAHADSGSGVKPLADLITGESLEDWVRWLEVRNRGRTEPLSGRVDIREVRVLEIREEAALAAVDAIVTLTLEMEDGERVRSPRRFGGPMVLTRSDRQLGWEVVDATRDGRSMRRSISLLDGAMAERRGVRVEVVSIHRFSIGTVANLVIHNDTSSARAVDASETTLQADAGTVEAAGSTSTLKAPIRPGGSVEGSLDFPPIPLDWLPQKLVIRFAGDPGGVVVVDLPQTGFSVDTTV